MKVDYLTLRMVVQALEDDHLHHQVAHWSLVEGAQVSWESCYLAQSGCKHSEEEGVEKEGEEN